MPLRPSVLAHEAAARITLHPLSAEQSLKTTYKQPWSRPASSACRQAFLGDVL